MLWGDWNVCTFETLRLPLAKGSSTFSPSPSSSGSGDVTALRCSEPLRYKVGGASKPFAMVVRDGTAWGKVETCLTSKLSPSCAGWDRLAIKMAMVKEDSVVLIWHFSIVRKTRRINSVFLDMFYNSADLFF